MHAEDIDAVIDLNEMIEIDRRSGRTLSIQRVKSQSHIGKETLYMIGIKCLSTLIIMVLTS